MRLSLLVPCLFFASMTTSAQSTGMGVVLPNPSPRDPDLHDTYAAQRAPDENAKRQLAMRVQQQKAILEECNQILILAHDLRMKVLQPAASNGLPSNTLLTEKIAKTAKKVQQEETGASVQAEPNALDASASKGTPPSTAAAPPPADPRAQLLVDTRRLFQLAAELKLELVKTPPGSISLTVSKKAAEVEVLALNLGQRMKE